MAKQRRKHFKIDGLPDSLRSAIHDLFQKGVTYAEITSYIQEHPLRPQDVSVSPAAVARYGADWMRRLERIRTVNEQAKAIIEESDGSPLRLEEAATQISLGLMTEHLLQLQDLEGADPVELMRALAHLQSSSAARERLRASLREQLRKELNEELKKSTQAAAADIAAVASKGGLSADAIAEIKEKIFGLAG